ncbi:MAG: hypothetical protein KDN20_07495 [Verrucomicrobiae bacterium]|nr:hypothetical protein [Verrucomicrobiae bacterium]
MDQEAYIKILEKQIRAQTAERIKMGLGPHISEIEARKQLEKVEQEVKENQGLDGHGTVLDELKNEEREKLVEQVADMTEDLTGAARNLEEKSRAQYSQGGEQAVLQNETRASSTNQDITNPARDFSMSGVGLAAAVAIGGALAWKQGAALHEKFFGKDKPKADKEGSDQTQKEQPRKIRAAQKLKELEDRQLKMKQSKKPKL